MPKLGPNPLAVWLAQNPTVRQMEVARRIRTSRSYLGQIVHDIRSPSYKVAVALEEATYGAVPTKAWHERWMRGERRGRRNPLAQAS